MENKKIILLLISIGLVQFLFSQEYTEPYTSDPNCEKDEIGILKCEYDEGVSITVIIDKNENEPENSHEEDTDIDPTLDVDSPEFWQDLKDDEELHERLREKQKEKERRRLARIEFIKEQEIQQIKTELRKKTTEFIDLNGEIIKKLINREIKKKIEAELGKKVVDFLKLTKRLKGYAPVITRKIGGIFLDIMQLKSCNGKTYEEWGKLEQERRLEIEASVRKFYREELMTFENEVNEEKLQVIEPFLSDNDKYELNTFLTRRDYDLFGQKVDYIYEQISTNSETKFNTKNLEYRGEAPPKNDLPPGTYIENNKK